ncbi:MAG: hypothetical protein Q9161_005907 [Pseudevernia consocians]
MSAPNPPATAFPSSQRLLDKVAVITGASSGLGRAIALAYATHGAIVVCADLQPVAQVHMKEEDVKATHDVILDRGGRSLFVECNVRDSQSVQSLVARVVEVYDRLDIMVNNAGIGLEARSFVPIHETSDSTFDTTMSVNSRGVFLGCKYAARQMITQDPYPSVAKTAMLKPLTDVEATQVQLGALHPFKGLGEPEDIAKVAVFLASDDASWVTGAALPVDGKFFLALIFVVYRGVVIRYFVTLIDCVNLADTKAIEYGIDRYAVERMGRDWPLLSDAALRPVVFYNELPGSCNGIA